MIVQMLKKFKKYVVVSSRDKKIISDFILKTKNSNLIPDVVDLRSRYENSTCFKQYLKLKVLKSRN